MQAVCSCSSPTHLQAQVISAMHSGNDIRIFSSSSRERRLSYLVPAIQTVHDSNTYTHNTECSYPSLLIIAPSRHCCAQLQDLTKELISGVFIFILYCTVGNFRGSRFLWFGELTQFRGFIFSWHTHSNHLVI